jgi:UDP-N-acetylmuramoyl-tripeptide--D-alanyl-D-alanine ligase
VAENAAPIVDGALSVQSWKGEAIFAADQRAAIAALDADLRPGDVVLVKGSRYRTWEVADSLREPAATEEVRP